MTLTPFFLPRAQRNDTIRASLAAFPEAHLDIFLQQLVNGLTLGSVYAVVALGYTMVYGIIQLIISDPGP